MGSIVFLAFTIIIFLITYGLMWLFVPMILGIFMSQLGQMEIDDPDWYRTYQETESIVQWIIPLIPTMGIFVICIKILMVATTHGRG